MIETRVISLQIYCLFFYHIQLMSDVARIIGEVSFEICSTQGRI